jgi:catechol 2,3-dioxygenase-like lactoylglutathione lyase family enzyme
MIQHVTREIPPSTLNQCVDFYAILGFAVVPVPPGIEGRAVWLAHGDAQIHLVPTTAAQLERGHFGVVVEDYAGTLQALRRAGHEADRRREHWGSPRAYVRDPAGQLVELMAFAPARRPE